MPGGTSRTRSTHLPRSSSPSQRCSRRSESRRTTGPLPSAAPYHARICASASSVSYTAVPSSRRVRESTRCAWGRTGIPRTCSGSAGASFERTSSFGTVPLRGSLVPVLRQPEQSVRIKRRRRWRRIGGPDKGRPTACSLQRTIPWVHPVPSCGKFQRLGLDDPPTCKGGVHVNCFRLPTSAVNDRQACTPQSETDPVLSSGSTSFAPGSTPWNVFRIA